MAGDWEGGYGAILSQGADAAIFGPFGGDATVGADTWAARGAAAVRQFRNGVSKLHVVKAWKSGDLVVTVAIEEQRGEIAGASDQNWTLRVTQVWRREDGHWRVLHRHADPLSRARTLAETLAIAAG